MGALGVSPSKFVLGLAPGKERPSGPLVAFAVAGAFHVLASDLRGAILGRGWDCRDDQDF